MIESDRLSANDFVKIKEYQLDKFYGWWLDMNSCYKSTFPSIATVEEWDKVLSKSIEYNFSADIDLYREENDD